MKATVILGCLGFAVISGGARADDHLPSTEEAIKELKAAYGRNPGYIATYQCKGENKNLEYTVAIDMASGLSASHLIAVKPEGKMETRIWNTADDRVYVAADKDLAIIRGMKEEVLSLVDLERKIAPASDQGTKTGLFQDLLLNETGIEARWALRSGSAQWLSDLDESVVKVADPESFTFETKTKGMLTINRKTSLVKRQWIKRSGKEDLALELTDYKPNPGSKAIEDLCRDWPTLGAREMNAAPLMTPFRLVIFQMIISSVENGGAALGKLEGALEEQKDVTRRFIKCCVASSANSLTLAKWRKLPLPDKDEVRKIWLKDVPGARIDDEEAFKKFLNSAGFRQPLRDTVVEGLLNHEGAVDKVTSDLFGEGVWKQLRTKDETGQTAKDLLGKAVARAFLEVMIERRMNEAWGNPEGLD